MKAWVALLAAAAAMPLLAGCSGPSPDTPLPIPSGVEGSELENGTFYAFAHRGGDLAFSVADNGSADVVLYGADDQRIGHIGVGAEQARGRFVLDGVGPGDLVLHALAINGTLDVRSRGAAVAEFRALPFHVERHLLVQRDASLPSLPPVNPGPPVDEVVEVRLLRAPSSVSVLAKATYESIDVSVTGRSGPVHEVQAGSGPFATPGAPFTTLPGESRPENIRDGQLTVRVQASGFDGILVLEARSFSRAEPTGPSLRPTTDVPRFTYGELPDQPVGFEVRAGTNLLYLWQEGEPDCGDVDEDEQGEADDCRTGKPAHVALFGPGDERVATVAVPANGTIALSVAAVGEGAWVAVLLDGQATLGADRVPGDFELHPIGVAETIAPEEAAGEAGGAYGASHAAVQPAGVPFRAAPVNIEGRGGTFVPGDPSGFDFFGSCDEGSVSLLLGGETIGAWGFGLGRHPALNLTPIDPALLLGDGELEVAYDDFGPDCPRTGVQVTGYTR